MQVAALPPGWPPREANASVRESTPTEGNDEHPKCSPCNRYRILITPMFGMVLGIIGINYAPYVLWTPHATWLSWIALVSPLTLLPASIIGEPASHYQPFASPAACLSNPHQPALAPGQPASVLSSAGCASHAHQPPPRPHQAIFHVLLLLLFASYLHCVLTDPGTVPQAWHDRIASDPQLAARYRLCHKSGLYRPPRSHYCSVTERTLTLTPTPTLTQPNPQPQPQLHPHPRPSPNSNPKPHPHAQA